MEDEFLRDFLVYMLLFFLKKNIYVLLLTSHTFPKFFPGSATNFRRGVPEDNTAACNADSASHTNIYSVLFVDQILIPLKKEKMNNNLEANLPVSQTIKIRIVYNSKKELG